MVRATTEEAFEALIEHHLLEHGGYLRREAKDFDLDLAVIRQDLLAYVQDTQPKVWAKQQGIHGTALETTLLSAFAKAAKQVGVLHVLRHGFKFYGSTVRLATFRPAHGLNPEVEELYAKNRVAVMRQVHYDPKAKGRELDLVLFVNGIPVVTAELKNAMTQQTAYHAKKQYKAALTRGPVSLNQDMKALIPQKSLLCSDYLAWQLAARQTEILSLTEESGHGTKVLRTGLLASLKVLVPPVGEQCQLSSRVFIEAETFSRADLRLKRSVSKLKEYRQALITATVTGQLDIPEAATWLKSKAPPP